MGGNLKNLFLFLAVSAAVIGISSAATLTVGDKTGWTIPSPASFYTTWASHQKIQVGDSLVFTFPAGIHTVAEVSKSDYDSCTAASPLSAVLSTAPAKITVSSPGTHYFICTIAGHCAAGQKLAVVATGPSPTKAPKSAKKASSPAPAPASVIAVTPSSVPTTTVDAGSPIGVAPGTAAPPVGNFAAANAVGFVGLVSIAVAALLV